MDKVLNNAVKVITVRSNHNFVAKKDRNKTFEHDAGKGSKFCLPTL